MNKKILFLILLIIVFIFDVQFANAVGSDTLNNIIKSIKSALWGVGYFLAAIGFLVAGVIWLTSGGSPEKTGLARKALIAAAIGTAVVIIGSGADTVIKIVSEIIGFGNTP